MKKIKLLLLSFLSSFLLASCYEVNERDAFAEIILTQGNEDTVLTFEFPTRAEDGELFARRSTSGENAYLYCYRFDAQNTYNNADSIDALSVTFVPAQVDEKGKMIDAKATVVYTKIVKTANAAPMPRTFILTKDANFTSENYSLPSCDGGELKMSWAIEEEKSVAAESVWTDYDVKSYNIKSVRFSMNAKM